MAQDFEISKFMYDLQVMEKEKNELIEYKIETVASRLDNNELDNDTITFNLNNLDV